jgi:hypothetical protein
MIVILPADRPRGSGFPAIDWSRAIEATAGDQRRRFAAL